MKRILIMTMQITAVWAILVMLFYTWSKNNAANLAFPMCSGNWRLLEPPVVCSVFY